MVSMMCPGISYSTVHSLIFHNNGSVQENKLFTEFCNRNQAIFSYDNAYKGIWDYMIDNLTLTLINQPPEKYDGSHSGISSYEIIAPFIKIHNISATWEMWHGFEFNATYQLIVGSMFCSKEGLMFECCPPM